MGSTGLVLYLISSIHNVTCSQLVSLLFGGCLAAPGSAPAPALSSGGGIIGGEEAPPRK